MTAITENDLKRLEDLINNRFDLINSRFDELSKGQKALEIGQAEMKAELKGFDKRLDDVNNRLNIMTVGFLSIVGILVTGILGIIGKVVFFPSP